MLTNRTSDSPTYGDDRVRRLRIALGALGATALIGVAVAAYVLVITPHDTPGPRGSALVLVVISTVLVVVSTATWVVLPRRTPFVRRAAAGCGFLALAAGLPTAGLAFGFIWAVIGMGILLLALGADEQ